jgi:integrase
MPDVEPAQHDLTFDELVRGYLEDYELHGYRAIKSARSRIAQLRRRFGDQTARRITAGAIRDYQLDRRRAGAATGTINRETSALSRMFRLAIRRGALAEMPTFPDRLTENPPRQGFFEHAEYLAVRGHLPAPYQDILDFAYYSGWRRLELTELTWAEVDLDGGVVRLDPHRSKTRTGRVLPISPPLAVVFARRQARRRGDDPRVFGRDGVTVRAWRRAWPDACGSISSSALRRAYRTRAQAWLAHECAATSRRHPGLRRRAQ